MVMLKSVMFVSMLKMRPSNDMGALLLMSILLTGARQMGHIYWFLNQLYRHFRWNICWHGNVLATSNSYFCLYKSELYYIMTNATYLVLDMHLREQSVQILLDLLIPVELIEYLL